MNKDLQIFDLIAEERARQTKGIELIASENFVSDQVTPPLLLMQFALRQTATRCASQTLSRVRLPLST